MAAILASRSARSRAGLLAVLRAIAFGTRRPPGDDHGLPRLDPRALSPHLQRDLGLLDGNDPCGPRA